MLLSRQDALASVRPNLRDLLADVDHPRGARAAEDELRGPSHCRSGRSGSYRPCSGRPPLCRPRGGLTPYVPDGNEERHSQEYANKLKSLLEERAAVAMLSSCS